jgi:hypothetical protein
MQLPDRDAAFLTERGFDWELVADPNGSVAVIIHELDVGGGGFAPERTDLMIRIPPQYPMTPLDMWYCDPPVRVAATGQFATATEVMETHVGRTWQRFSRHLPGTWRPAADGLRSFLVLIQRELQGVGQERSGA